MGTTLTGTTPQDTYDSLIKVTDNGPLSGTAKYLSDGLGNDSILSLSTTALGIGTASPTSLAQLNGTAGTTHLRISEAGSTIGFFGGANGIIGGATGSMAVRAEAGLILSSQGNAQTMTLTSTGNVGIGTSAPATTLSVAKSSNSGSGSTFPRLSVLNTLATQGDGSTTFNFSDVQVSSGDGAVNMFLATTYAAGTWAPSGQLNVSTNHPLVFKTNNTEVARLTAAGVLDLAQGQIKFPATQVASADPNTLDDYEEGTWTMGVSFGGASVGVTYSANTGTYTKIGRQVTVNGNMTLTSKGSSTGLARITGLPFVIGSGGSYSGIASVNFENITFTGQFQPIASVGDTVIVPQFVTEAGVNNNTSDANFSDTSRIAINFTYFV